MREVMKQGGIMATKMANVTAHNKLATRDSITKAEFDTMMQTGLTQAKRNDSVSVDEAFDQLKSETSIRI